MARGLGRTSVGADGDLETEGDCLVLEVRPKAGSEPCELPCEDDSNEAFTVSYFQ